MVHVPNTAVVETIVFTDGKSATFGLNTVKFPYSEKLF